MASTVSNLNHQTGEAVDTSHQKVRIIDCKQLSYKPDSLAVSADRRPIALIGKTLPAPGPHLLERGL